jgi:spore coat protein H
MKFNAISYLLLILILIINLPGCRKIDEEVRNPEKEVLNFTVTEAQREFINKSRGDTFEVTNPVPALQFAGRTFTIDRFEIRGESSLNFERKGFGVNMGNKLTLTNPFEKTERRYEEFKLVAMVFDYTYMEHSIATAMLREVNLWPVYSFFTEVKLNNHTQGLYLFIEDPVEYFIEQRNSSFVLRRGYNHSVRAYYSGPDKVDPQIYLLRFKKIYSDIVSYSGQQLYDTLSTRLDLEQYFTKLGIDLLLKNGDCTDELFLYTKIRNNKEIFGFFPWDFDDLFSDLPHEIGRSWAIGTVFGKRSYSGMNAVIADVGSKLLFSIEDDLDYKIAKDNILYQKYLITLRTVIEKIDQPTIDKIFDYTFEHISPFYSNDSVTILSKFDANATNYDLFVNNLAKKRQFLKDRRNWILQEINAQQIK